LYSSRDCSSCNPQGMTKDENYRELLMRLTTALAKTEAAYVEAQRSRNGLSIGQLCAGSCKRA
jgi:hypothetical protein